MMLKRVVSEIHKQNSSGETHSPEVEDAIASSDDQLIECNCTIP